MAQKVTDPKKIVTDKLVLKRLAEQGIDKDYVEFFQDYASRFVGGKRVKGQSPYAKFYRDLKSGKRFMVVSGLPKVNAAGVKIGGDTHNSPVVGWEQISPGVFISKPNLFTASVTSTGIEVICDSDQPDGRKENDKVAWNPQLFLNGIEQTCGEAILLATDPTNHFYHDNVLEWDYGICKRRIRIIEGRIRERWVFASNPNGEVRIKHNQSGDYKLRLGEYAVNEDEELVPVQVFNESEYPFEVGASPETFYPDQGVASVDGYVSHDYGLGEGESWANLKAAAGTLAADDVTTQYPMYILTPDVEPNWRINNRGIYLFDTSGLPDGVIVTAATFSISSSAKADTLSAAPTLNAYKSTPFSNVALQADDYVDVGAVALSSAIAYADWVDDGYNDFVLIDVDTDDFGYIPVDGVTKLGLREATYDAGTSTPPWSSVSYCRVQCYFTEQGTGFQPKLVVTYTVPEVAKPTFRLDPRPRTRMSFHPNLKLGG